MHLPPASFKPPEITVTHEGRDFLVALYNEMVGVYNNPNGAFDQQDCAQCVIGNGIRAGIFDSSVHELDANYEPTPDRVAMIEFQNALTILEEEISVDDTVEEDLVMNFLFQSNQSVYRAANLLSLPDCVYGRADPEANRRFDERDACVRIAAVLSRAGYNITVEQLQDIPADRMM